jgi:hypothetical protein
MLLWLHWWSVASQLRPACSRRRTFCWLLVVLAALCTRQDVAGVTSFVRALGLRVRCYGCLLDFFHNRALCSDKLARIWTGLILKVHPGIVRCNGRLVVLADGIKKGKCGRKMPAVKLLHQSGESNTKPAYIMGHSCQALALLGQVGRFHHAVPLCARIHEGFVFSNRDQRTLLDKLLLLLADLHTYWSKGLSADTPLFVQHALATTKRLHLVDTASSVVGVYDRTERNTWERRALLENPDEIAASLPSKALNGGAIEDPASVKQIATIRKLLDMPAERPIPPLSALSASRILDRIVTEKAVKELAADFCRWLALPRTVAA